MEGKTVFLISHRVSTVKNADNIIVLERGEVIEKGDHDNLMDQQGYYYHLHEKQMLEKSLYQGETG